MDYNQNAERSNQSLEVEQIIRLGLTREEFQQFSKDKPDIVEGFFDINPEMVVGKVTKDCKLLNIEQIKEFPVKKDTYIVLRMTNFIALFEKGLIKPTPFFKKYYKSYKGEDLNNKSLLVYVYGAGMGDMLFQQAVLRKLKEKYPRVFITFAVPEKYMKFAESWNTVDRVICNVFTIHHYLNADYHLNFEFIIRSPEGFKENVYKCFKRRASLNIPDNEVYPAIPSNPEQQRYWLKLLEKKKVKDFIIVQFLSANPMRNPRPQFRKELLDRLIDEGYDIVFVDHPSNYDEVNKLVKHSKNPKQCHNFIKKSQDLISSAALMSLSKLIISVDTGAIHLAAAVGVPVYGIYGPFNGYIRLDTYPNCKWIDSDLDCSPCLEHDLENCVNSKNGFPLCYDQYNINKIISEIKNLLI